MKTVWVVVLSLFALVLGSCGGAVWKGTTGIFESIRIACAITTTADSSGLMTKAQVADAIDRLLELLREASIRPKPRRATRPTLGSKMRRLDGKKRRGDIKANRNSRGFDD